MGDKFVNAFDRQQKFEPVTYDGLPRFYSRNETIEIGSYHAEADVGSYDNVVGVRLTKIKYKTASLNQNNLRIECDLLGEHNYQVYNGGSKKYFYSMPLSYSNSTEHILGNTTYAFDHEFRTPQSLINKLVFDVFIDDQPGTDITPSNMLTIELTFFMLRK